MGKQRKVEEMTTEEVMVCVLFTVLIIGMIVGAIVAKAKTDSM